MDKEAVLTEEAEEGGSGEKPLPKVPSRSSSSFLSSKNSKKRRSPPSVPKKDYSDEVEDDGEWDDEDSTMEYKSSAPDSLEEEETVTLGPRRPIGQNLRFTRSASMLRVYGIACLILAIGVIGCGVSSFHYNPSLVRRHSFQMEWKWSNLMLLTAGVSALLMASRESLAAVSGLLCSSLLAGAMSAATAVVHVVNLHFRRLDYDHHHPESMDKAEAANSVGTVNLFLLILGIAGAIVSLLMYRHGLHIAGKNFGFNGAITRRRLRLSLIGLSQIILGMLITGWWMAIEALFQGHNVDFHSLPSSEVLSHGLVFIVCGYIQMMATSKGCRPLLLSASLLSGASLLLAAFYSAKPVSLIYLTIEMNAATGEDSIDVKFGLFVLLTIFYILEVGLAGYSVHKFLGYTLGEGMGRIELVTGRSERLLHIALGGQVCIGAIYAVLEMISVGLLFAYKMDFSGLPVIILGSGCIGLLAMSGRKRGSSWLILITIALSALCAAEALRDLYLFGLHAIGGPMAADGVRASPFSGGSLAIHFMLALVALAELIVSISLIFLLSRVLLQSVSCLINRIQYSSYLWSLRLLSVVQVAAAAIGAVAALAAVMGRQAHIEVLGDTATSLFILMGLGALLALVGLQWRRMPAMIMAALGVQLTAFLLIWQEMDEMSYLIHYHLDQSDETAATPIPVEGAEEPIDNPQFQLSVFILLDVLLLWCSCLCSLLLLSELLEQAKIGQADGVSAPVKSEELVKIHQNDSGEKEPTIEFKDDPEPPPLPLHGSHS